MALIAGNMSVHLDMDLSSRISKNSYDSRRRKLFEDLRKNNIMPFQGRLKEFLTKVENYKGENGKANLKGTSQIYLSSFWKLIGKHSLSKIETRQLITQILIQSNLLLEEGNIIFEDEYTTQANAYSSLNRQEYPIKNFVSFQYFTTLGKILLKMESVIEQLSLVGALFREFYMAGNLRFTVELEPVFYELLDKFIEDSSIDAALGARLKRICNKRVLALTSEEYLEGTKQSKYIEQLMAHGPTLINHGSLAAYLLQTQDTYAGPFYD